MSTDHYTRRPYTKPEPDYLNLRFMLYPIPQFIQPYKYITKKLNSGCGIETMHVLVLGIQTVACKWPLAGLTTPGASTHSIGGA